MMTDIEATSEAETEVEEVETTKEQEESEGTFGDVEAGPEIESDTKE
jgi:hypothetical protein